MGDREHVWVACVSMRECACSCVSMCERMLTCACELTPVIMCVCVSGHEMCVRLCACAEGYICMSSCDCGSVVALAFNLSKRLQTFLCTFGGNLSCGRADRCLGRRGCCFYSWLQIFDSVSVTRTHWH